jgi:GTPase KRas protein
MNCVTIALLGAGGVGKSTLVVRFCQDRFAEEYDPSIEDYYKKITTIDGVDFDVTLWDTCPQDGHGFYKQGQSPIELSQGFLLVYSSSSRRSFEEVEEFRDEILRKKGLESVPMILIANKSDLMEEVSVGEGEVVAVHWNVSFFQTSAKTNTNVNEVIHKLVLDVIQHPHRDRLGTRPVQRRRNQGTKLSSCSLF